MNTFLLLVFTIFSLFSFGAITYLSDPYFANIIIKTLFFVTMFFSLVGLFSLFGIWASRMFKRSKETIDDSEVFRRGALIAGLCVMLVGLQTFSLLNIGNAFAVLLLVMGMEMAAVYKKQYSKNVV